VNPNVTSQQRASEAQYDDTRKKDHHSRYESRVICATCMSNENIDASDPHYLQSGYNISTNLIQSVSQMKDIMRVSFCFHVVSVLSCLRCATFDLICFFLLVPLSCFLLPSLFPLPSSFFFFFLQGRIVRKNSMKTEIANQVPRSNDEEKNKVDTDDGGLIIATVRAKAMWKSLMEDGAHPDEIEIAAANYRKLAEETSEMVSEKAGRESNNAAKKRAKARRKKYSKLLSKNYLSSKLASKRKQSKSKKTQQRQEVGGLELGYIYENGGDEKLQFFLEEMRAAGEGACFFFFFYGSSFNFFFLLVGLSLRLYTGVLTFFLFHLFNSFWNSFFFSLVHVQIHSWCVRVSSCLESCESLKDEK